MANYTKEFLEKTAELWRPLATAELNEEDAREIIHNVTGFFSILKKWDDEERKKQENERDCDLRSPNNPGQA